MEPKDRTLVITGADPLAPSWHTAPRTAADPLTTQSVTDCVLFALAQPRDCFIRSFRFEQL